MDNKEEYEEVSIEEMEDITSLDEMGLANPDVLTVVKVMIGLFAIGIGLLAYFN